MRVELIPHVGVQDGREVRLGQSYVTVDGQHVGYVGDHANAHVSFICPVPDEVRQSVEEHLQRTRGYKPVTVEPPAFETVESLASAE